VGQPIVHFEIMAKQAAKARQFYSQLFDWKVNEPIAELGNYCMVDGGSSGLAGGIGEEPGGGTRTTIYVAVPDLQKTLDQAVSLGGKVVMPPTEIPNVVTFAMFSDPDGNVVGLVKG
jgi:predicted enzyme related to lactoylglutathione lyase